MRMQRFTIRTMIVLVVVVAVASTAETWRKRRNAYLREAALASLTAKLDEWNSDPRRRSCVGPRWTIDQMQMMRKRAASYRLRQLKYERAARYPWLPVKPIPPSPG
jgi:hypothetical protein